MSKTKEGFIHSEFKRQQNKLMNHIKVIIPAYNEEAIGNVIEIPNGVSRNYCHQ
jgi:cellulose synthase/poly-beta-1,6-N-acetylglucosamine synthase-like glycosyltransferase